ncbi:MAG: hypothetical protein ACRC5M_02190 [Anaeroplasmataceae bacterium]
MEILITSFFLLSFIIFTVRGFLKKNSRATLKFGLMSVGLLGISLTIYMTYNFNFLFFISLFIFAIGAFLHSDT